LAIIIGFYTSISFRFWGGPYMTELFNKIEEKKIDDNGARIKAAISKKNDASKGNVLVYQYVFKNNSYISRESCNKQFYAQLMVGDSVEIVLDTTNHNASYLILNQ